jgi:hypothetical protein
LFPSAGSFYSALTEFQRAVLLASILSSEEKSKHRGIFDKEIKRGTDAWEKLKNGLHKKKTEYKEIVVLSAMLIEC